GDGGRDRAAGGGRLARVRGGRAAQPGRVRARGGARRGVAAVARPAGRRGGAERQGGQRDRDDAVLPEHVPGRRVHPPRDVLPVPATRQRRDSARGGAGGG